MSSFVKDGELLVFACMVVKTLNQETTYSWTKLHATYNHFALLNRAHFFYGAVFVNRIAFDLTPC